MHALKNFGRLLIWLDVVAVPPPNLLSHLTIFDTNELFCAYPVWYCSVFENLLQSQNKSISMESRKTGTEFRNPHISQRFRAEKKDPPNLPNKLN